MSQEEGYRGSLQIKLDNWLFNNDFSENSLEIFSKLYVIFSLFIYGIGEMFGSSFVEVSKISDIFFNPPFSIVQFFSGFPSKQLAWVLDILLHVLFGLAFFSIRPAIVFFLIFLLTYTSNAYGYSFGKIDHNFVSLILPLILSLGHLLKSKASQKIGFTKAIYCFLIGFAFFTAGLPKLFSGEWLNIWHHSVKAYTANYSIITETLANSLGINRLLFNLHGILWEVMDYFTLSFELLFLVAAFNHKQFLYFILLACFFHLGTYLFLNIGFFHHFICYLFFVDWSKFKKLKKTSKTIETSNNFQKVILSFPFGLLAFFPNSLFFFISTFENSLIKEFSFFTFIVSFIIFFLWILTPIMKKDLTKLKKEIWALWHAEK